MFKTSLSRTTDNKGVLIRKLNYTVKNKIQICSTSIDLSIFISFATQLKS